MRKIVRLIVGISVLLYITVGSDVYKENTVTPTFITNDAYKTFYKVAKSPVMAMSKLQAWKTVVPEVRAITIKSSADSSDQPALFYDSRSAHAKPLLVVLHSWSENYQAQYSIPYGILAVKNDWVFMHPDYRGTFTNPLATASELAVKDILDAVAYAKAHAWVDESRVYLTGFSGGGMMTLIMAGRYPDMWAGAAAWVPVYDLTQWYETTRNSRHDYSGHIANSCGGNPLRDSTAAGQCRRRSVSTYLRNARNHKVRVFIAAGILDNFVPVGHAIQAFNDLAAEEDRISAADIDYINTYHRLPRNLSGMYVDRLFEDAGLQVLFERQSASVTLKIFNSRHDVVYNAGLYWLSRQGG
jgi:predicted esterase